MATMPTSESATSAETVFRTVVRVSATCPKCKTPAATFHSRLNRTEARYKCNNAFFRADPPNQHAFVLRKKRPPMQACGIFFILPHPSPL